MGVSSGLVVSDGLELHDAVVMKVVVGVGVVAVAAGRVVVVVAVAVVGVGVDVGVGTSWNEHGVVEGGVG